jgi:hypothetical protein
VSLLGDWRSGRGSRPMWCRPFEAPSPMDSRGARGLTTEESACRPG